MQDKKINSFLKIENIFDFDTIYNKQCKINVRVIDYAKLRRALNIVLT